MRSYNLAIIGDDLRLDENQMRDDSVSIEASENHCDCQDFAYDLLLSLPTGNCGDSCSENSDQSINNLTDLKVEDLTSIDLNENQKLEVDPALDLSGSSESISLKNLTAGIYLIKIKPDLGKAVGQILNHWSI